MTTKLLTRIVLIFLLAFSHFLVQAQLPAGLKKGGVYTYLNADSSSFIRFQGVSQIWFRYNQNNPGSTLTGGGFPAAGELRNSTSDVGIRRIRLLLSGQISPRVFFFVQFGQNSWNYLSARKAGSFFHDVTVEYNVVRKAFTIGGGLNGWTGPGRFSNSSVSTILGLDPPLFQETTNDINDQFVRALGIYAKGKLGKFDYRIALNKPLILTQASTVPPTIGATLLPNTPQSTYATNTTTPASTGYFMYQFFDQESNAQPSTVGTYLGKKKIFNIGAGFKYQKNAMWAKQTTGDTTYHQMALFAFDVFYDAPLSSQGNALTLYGGFFHYDYGKGYLRIENPMNVTNGLQAVNGFKTVNGTGNGYPGIGTGNTLYGQAAYKLKDNILGDRGTLQFYLATQYSKYDALNDPMILLNMGVNWLIIGHNSKFTLNYQNRPVFSQTTADPTELKSISRKGEYVLQYQISF